MRQSETLGLIIDTGSVKPAGIMKTLSRTFVFVVLAVIAIGTVLSFRAFAVGSRQKASADKRFVLTIGRTTEDYVDVDKGAFDTALTALASNGGQYDIGFMDAHGKVTHPYHPPYHALNIKTDKVTTSEVAQNAPAGESAANDPNVTHFLYSDSATYITAVLATFK
jgi:hypothetical protein